MGFFDHVGSDANGARTEWNRLQERHWEEFAARGKKRKAKGQKESKDNEDKPKVRLTKKAKQRLAELARIAQELNSVEMQQAVAELEAELK